VNENASEIGVENTEEGEKKPKKKGGDTKYEGLTKQERKKLIKDENREKRKNKIPKHIKKKAE
jgi:RIO kinase 1